MNDRRKHPRYRVKDKVFAVHWMAPTRIGQIIDVSLSGLAFSYLDQHPYPDEPTEIGILFSDDKFFLKQIPFQSISDTAIPGHPLSSVAMRRHGGQFTELTPAQEKELHYFIKNHTTTPA
ncbi:MAG: PilZ domain-containing protein [Deltaproteobacteria bacterium]|nr:PilZ domain-containing protein [Deltaproteobacteria bacterium]